MRGLLKILFLTLVLIVALPCSVYSYQPNQTNVSLAINEFLASNSSYGQDTQGQYDDWIEIYNYGTHVVGLAGKYLTDDLSSPTKWRVPDSNPSATIVPAGGYLLIWADEDVTDAGLHANFKLSSDGEEIGLFDSDGNSLIDSVVFGRQTTDVSYGRYPDAADDWRFLATPTPHAENEDAYLGRIADIQLSHKRGFYNTPFSVTIATETEGATIYYTLDGTEPYGMTAHGFSRGAVYNGPVPISKTTCLRVRAVKTGWESTDVDTHTYIFLDDVIVQDQQQALREGYIDTWSNFPADYEMDPEVYNDPDYADFMDDALLSIPTLSIVTDKENLFGSSAGIYTHPLNEGLEWERPTSVELFDPNGSKEFQVNCGLRIQGGHSRHPHKCPKHSFSLRFRGIYGPTTLDYNLFGEDWPANSFNLLHLRGFFNNAWTHWGSDQRERAQYIRDQWMRDSLTEMGNQDALQGFPVHLYLNGLYWGVYSLHERPDASHYAAYNGGNEDDIDAINGDPTYVISDPLNTGSVTDGTIDAWLELKEVVADRNWERICQLLDIDSFIDWTILFYFAGTTDIKQGTNWRATGGGSQRKPWRFYSWDAEHVMENVNQFGIGTVSDPSGLFGYLENISEFRTRFGDRVHKHLFNNGALTTERNLERWIKRSDELRLAVIAESARWGDYRRDVHSYSSGPYYLYTRNDFWIPENDYITDDYLPRRTEIALNMFRSRDMYPRTEAPVFHINGSYRHGGRVTYNDELSMTASTGTIYYTLNGSDPRLPQDSPGNINVTSIVAESAAKRVVVPITSVSEAWKGGQSFNDSAWRLSTGAPGGVGYERSTGYENLISLDLENQMYNSNTSCYIRIPFAFNESPYDFDFLTLRVRYDDGFIAYLNGVELARRNFTGTPAWNSGANATHSDAEAIYFEDIDVSSSFGALRSGSNILAIHGLNASSTSSDFLISVELTATKEEPSNSDDDDDVSPGVFQYSGSIPLTQSVHVKARARVGSSWSALNEATFSVGPVAEGLRITEIMYHPYNPDDAGEPNEEYIELKNIGTQTINLNLVKFTNGIDFTFGDMELAPNEYVVVVQDIDAFESRYGQDVNIAGQYSGRLNDAGERIRLEDAIGQTISDFSYEDNWYSVTDGEGFSLTIIEAANDNPDSWNGKDSWRASAYTGGSPGADDSGIIPNPGVVVINELLANSPGGSPDWIELYTTTENAINIGGWYLSDDGSNLTKYRIADGTVIGPYGYIVFYEDQHFDNQNNSGCVEPFALSGNGEQVYLSSAENDVITGYRQVEDFGASETGVSFGRYYKSSTDNYNFVAMAENTPGSVNSYPKVGPVVITEIMYNPDWPEGGPYTNDQYEYIELYNISDEPVNLQGWSFTDGVAFTFASDVPFIIPSGGYLLVVKEPEAFSWRYPEVPAEQVVGPYEGRLNDAGERLELSMPSSDTDDSGLAYYIRIDRVVYSDGLHPENCPGGVDLWPVDSDGSGRSLSRRVASDYGNDPVNWTASDPSPGTINP